MSKMSKLVKIGINLPMSDKTLEWIEKHDPDLSTMIKKQRKKRGYDENDG